MVVTVAGSPIGIPSKRTRALLAYLALREGAEISRDVLVGLLWGERGQAQARASLRQSLSELRAALAGSDPQPILAGRETLTWRSGSAWVDAAAVAAAASSTDDAIVQTTASLIAGELLEGLFVGEPSFDQWLSAERQRFHQTACAA